MLKNTNIAELSELKQEIDMVPNKHIETSIGNVAQYRNLLSNIIYHVQFFKVSLPIIEKLALSVTNTTKQINMELTENIFKITKDSREKSEDIYNLLNNTTKGEDSLVKEVKDLTLISNKMREISDSHTKEINEIARESITMENTINEVYKFTKTIEDIAELTSLLAINTSIEAAREGIHGKGFKVIAGEIQKLSSSSKNASNSINKMMKNLVDYTKTYFNNHIRKLTDSVSSIKELTASLLKVSSFINSKVEIITNTGKDSRYLFNTINERINKAIYSLQYQDITRQQIENILKILREIMNNFKTDIETENINIELDIKLLENKAKEMASKQFTFREEYKSVNKELDETLKNIVDKKDLIIQGDLKGDITLF